MRCSLRFVFLPDVSPLNKTLPAPAFHYLDETLADLSTVLDVCVSRFSRSTQHTEHPNSAGELLGFQAEPYKVLTVGVQSGYSPGTVRVQSGLQSGLVKTRTSVNL